MSEFDLPLKSSVLRGRPPPLRTADIDPDERPLKPASQKVLAGWLTPQAHAKVVDVADLDERSLRPASANGMQATGRDERTVKPASCGGTLVADANERPQKQPSTSAVPASLPVSGRDDDKSKRPGRQRLQPHTDRRRLPREKPRVSTSLKTRPSGGDDLELKHDVSKHDHPSKVDEPRIEIPKDVITKCETFKDASKTDVSPSLPVQMRLTPVRARRSNSPLVPCPSSRGTLQRPISPVGVWSRRGAIARERSSAPDDAIIPKAAMNDELPAGDLHSKFASRRDEMKRQRSQSPSMATARHVIPFPRD